MEALLPHPVGLSRLAELICEDRSTRKIRQAGARGVAVVGDGTWLTLGEVVDRLNALGSSSRYNTQRVRRLADAGFLFADRPPAIGPGSSHRRIKATSVDEYEAAIRLPAAERATALAALRARNSTGQSEPTGEPS